MLGAEFKMPQTQFGRGGQGGQRGGQRGNRGGGNNPGGNTNRDSI
jgi:hypothetical protein